MGPTACVEGCAWDRSGDISSAVTRENTSQAHIHKRSTFAGREQEVSIYCFTVSPYNMEGGNQLRGMGRIHGRGCSERKKKMRNAHFGKRENKHRDERSRNDESWQMAS